MATATRKRKQSQATRRPGRPRKLTPELADEILRYAREGNYIEVAAQAAGIKKQTLYNWQARAAEYDDADQETLDGLDEETALLVWFIDALERESALAEVEALRAIRERPNRWQAEGWFLERRHQTRYRQYNAVEHSGAIATARLDPEKVAEELAAFGMEAATNVAAGPDAVDPPENA